MGLDAFVGSFNIGTGAAPRTQQVTTTGVTPLLVFDWWNYEVSAGDSAGSNDAEVGFGFTGGAAIHGLITGNSEDGQATSDVYQSIETTACAKQHLAGASTVQGTADFNAFAAGSYTLDITDTFVRDLRVGSLALGGADLSGIATGTITLNAVDDFTISGLAFTPTFVLLVAVSGNGAATRLQTSIGAATGPSNEWVVSCSSENSRDTSATSSYSRTDACCATYVVNSAAALANVGNLKEFTADGFTITCSVAAAAETYIYLALAGPSITVTTVNTRTDGNDIPVSGLDYDPVAVMAISHCRPESGAVTPDTDMIFSIGAASATDERVTHGSSDKNGEGTTICSSIIEHDAVWVKSDLAGGVAAVMDIKSFGTGGLVFVMDTVEPSAASLVPLIIFGPVASGLSIPIVRNNHDNQ